MRGSGLSNPAAVRCGGMTYCGLLHGCAAAGTFSAPDSTWSIPVGCHTARRLHLEPGVSQHTHLLLAASRVLPVVSSRSRESSCKLRANMMCAVLLPGEVRAAVLGQRLQYHWQRHLPGADERLSYCCPLHKAHDFLPTVLWNHGTARAFALPCPIAAFQHTQRASCTVPCTSWVRLHCKLMGSRYGSASGVHVRRAVE